MEIHNNKLNSILFLLRLKLLKLNRSIIKLIEKVVSKHFVRTSKRGKEKINSVP